MNATAYDIKLRYSVDGSAARTGTRGVIKDAKELQQTTDRVTSSMVRMGGAIVAAFGARAAGKALIGFNASIEDTRQGIAGMLALSKKTDLSDELANADRLMGNLQKRANKLPGTTAEYAAMAGMLAQPITAAGLGMKQLEDMTVNTVVASKALRVEASVAARDVDQALRGQYHSVDVFTGKLLGSIGYAGEEGRAKYNALDPQKRASELQRAIMQKQIDQLSSAQGQTFTGALSTLQDTVEQTLGKIGLPLFKAITAEIKTWNAYLDRNSNTVGDWAKSIGGTLVDAFGVVKSAVGFIVNHADMLIMIAKAWAAVKIGGAISGGLGSVLKGGGGTLARISAFGAGRSDNGRTDGGLGWEGGYKSEIGRGRASWKAGGIGGALPALGQALGAGLAIGTTFNELTGASHTLAGMFEAIHPRMDATSTKFDQLEASMTALDAATAKAARDSEGKTGLGAGFGGIPASNLQGLIASYKEHVNLADDVRRLTSGGIIDQLRNKNEAMDKYAAFQSSGGDVSKVEFERAEIIRLTEQGNLQRSQAEQAWLRGLDGLDGTQLKLLDQAQSQTAVLEFIQRGGLVGMLGGEGSPFASAFGGMVSEDAAIRSVMMGDAPGAKMNEKPKVNVTIQRIEVQSDDPDRFAFGMIQAFRDAAKNPSSALSALREG
jgi:hypothetical protein